MRDTAWPFNTEPIGFPETSVTNYQYKLRNILEHFISKWLINKNHNRTQLYILCNIITLQINHMLLPNRAIIKLCIKI